MGRTFQNLFSIRQASKRDGSAILSMNLRRLSIMEPQEDLPEAFKGAAMMYPFLVLDMCRVEFLDSFAISQLLQAQSICADQNSRLVLASPQPLIQRIMRLTGGRLPVYESVEAALSSKVL